MAARARQAVTVPSAAATAVPTRTGETEAGSVRGRAPASHGRSGRLHLLSRRDPRVSSL